MSDHSHKRHKKHAALAKRYGSKVRVGRFDWRIIFCQSLVFNGNEVLGLCVPGSRTIYVSVYDNIDTQETLIHELIHAEVYEAGLRQMPAWSSNIEELVSEAAARVLFNYDIRRRRSS
jgi:hypothetical protein